MAEVELTDPPAWTPVCCPFCGEDDFDLAGLRYHLKSGYCDHFDDDAVTEPAGRAAIASMETVEEGGADA